MKWLKMSHINDSKVDLGARKDRHEHINEGKIGEKGFKVVLKYLRKLSIVKGQLSKVSLPLILETEHDKVKADIKLLKKIV